MKKYTCGLLLALLIFLGCATAAGSVREDIVFSLQLPYYLGKNYGAVKSGEQLQALFSIENRGLAAQEQQVIITLPAGVEPVGQHDNWQLYRRDGQAILARQLFLEGGYSQWFDLLTVKVADDIQPGTYSVTVACNGQSQQIALKVVSGNVAAVNENANIEKIILPLNLDGKSDERLDSNTLVLRDRQLDYFKNVLRGKGATNLEVEAIHPVTHMALDIHNPARQQKLVVITVRLLDTLTHQPVSGLFTPGSTGEDKDAGSLGGHDNTLMSFTALTGEPTQRIMIPVFADERLLHNGQYMLQVHMDDGLSQPLVKNLPVKVVKKDIKAAMVVVAAVAIVAVALLAGMRYIRQVLGLLKIRWLVTIALFGAAAFAVVTVPSTLLSDFFHILLGPFGFIVTGLFHSVFLYTMLVALVVLIPRPGVVTLMTLVRMLLAMLAFGQISPLSFLSYGLHALLLEGLFTGSGLYRRLQAGQSGQTFSWQSILLAAAICGAADSVTTYVNLQSMAFLYRLYYAGWYVDMLVAINGFLYTAVGAACGMVLGSRLSRVGGD
ncbi:hypothetical protein SPFL3102_01862 [Sporomusaceae bacterium FL31]|nr:hypothetical protein SPFL3101_03496 [Sporomusaceae bacterium FL31]GCE34053.1 hypothetical protein SPFL3102_01862 [Sporomusaceae bacterium]